MTTTRKKRPRDPVQLGKLIVDIATGQTEDKQISDKNAAAVDLGRRGGNVRAEKLTAARRAAIAREGASARWAKTPADAEEE